MWEYLVDTFLIRFLSHSWKAFIKRGILQIRIYVRLNIYNPNPFPRTSSCSIKKRSGRLTSQALLSQREPGVQRGPPPCYLASTTEPTQPQRTVSQSVYHSPLGHQQQAVQISQDVNKASAKMKGNSTKHSF